MSEPRKLTGEPVPFAWALFWEMDEFGNHCIVSPDGRGNWAMYQSPAISICGNYICFTSYYEGTLPHEQILEVSEVPKIY